MVQSCSFHYRYVKSQATVSNRQQLLEKLKNLLETQFNELLFAYGFPTGYDTPNTAQTDRAIKLVQYAEQRQDLNHLVQLLRDILSSDPQTLELRQAVREELPDNAARKPVNPSHSSILRNTHSERLFAEFQQRLQDLPAAQHDAELLNALGKLANSVGEFKQAEALFQQAAAQQHDRHKQAESHYNAYRTALEQQQWQTALEALLRAIKADAEAFEPFPLRKYQPLQILGAGGFGTVFLCRNKYLDKSLVIKSLHNLELSRSTQDIFREAHVLQQIKHPNIIQIDGVDFADSAETRPYLVMEHFDGIALAAYLEKYGALTPAATRQLGVLIADAMQAAHQQNILHRDLKPANLLVRREGDHWQIKLIDFGLALCQQTVQKTLQGRLEHSILADSAAGTYLFAAPEQFGLRPESADKYSDVYSFGKTLSFSLFNTPNPSWKKHWQPLSEQGEKDLADLLDDCLLEDPQERPQGFAEVIERLNMGRISDSAIRQTPLESHPNIESKQSPPKTADGGAKRRVLSAFLGVLLVGVFLILNPFAEQDSPPPDVQNTPIQPPAEQPIPSPVAETPSKITVSKDESLNKEIPSKPEPEAIKHTLTLRSNVHKDTVWINNKNYGSTRLDVELPNGEYKIKIEKTGYETFEQTVQLDQHLTLKAELQAIRDNPAPSAVVAGRNFRDKLKSGGHAPEMVSIPAGSFMMGSDDGRDNEKPMHKVTVQAFAIGKYEVTQGEFAVFVERSGYKTEAETGEGCRGWTGSKWENKKEFTWRNVGFKQTDKHPVLCVSWNDAMAYTEWLSQETGQTYRLPTEAEWEYAARAGTSTKYWWGDESPVCTKKARTGAKFGYDQCGEIGTETVGSYQANAFGLYDVHGNLWEWTASPYAPYSEKRENTTLSKNHTKSLVLRGGSWNDRAGWLRVSYRGYWSAGRRYGSVGFRPARLF